MRNSSQYKISSISDSGDSDGISITLGVGLAYGERITNILTLRLQCNDMVLGCSHQRQEDVKGSKSSLLQAKPRTTMLCLAC